MTCRAGAVTGLSWRRQLPRLLSLLAIAVFFVGGWHAVPALGGEQYAWRNVAIGGGGYVTGIVAHPKEPNLIYIRTDVGGIYRFSPRPDEYGRNWIPLFDKFGLCCVNYFGVESIALDPSNPDIVYAAVGRDHYGGKGRVLKSTDRGGSWIETALATRMEANGPYKEMGERLAVDPRDGDLVYFGSREDGLLRSGNGGKSWKRVKSIPEAAAAWGIAFVLPDPNRRARKDRHHAPVYAGVGGRGVAVSEDGGKSWSDIGGPKDAVRAAIASDGALYVTAQTGVFRYDGHQWQDISPEAGKSFCAVSVDPRDPDTVIVSPIAPKFDLPLYISKDRGRNWRLYAKAVGNVSAKPNVPWWHGFAGATSALLFDPQIRGRLWLTDWSGTWIAEDYKNGSVLNFRTYERGHEELVITSLATPPVGTPLLSAVADAKGFRHETFDQFPKEAFEEAGIWASFGIDYAGEQAQHLARVGVRKGYGPEADGGVAVSDDSGRHWRAVTWDPKIHPVKIAVSATDPKLMVVLPVNGVPLRTADGGASWEASTGAPATTVENIWDARHPLAADRLRGNIFYLFSHGRFYRSDDGGTSWQAKAQLPDVPKVYVEAEPDEPETVWVSLGAAGLFVTRDGGETFTKIETLKTSKLFGLGRHNRSSLRPTLYTYGELSAKPGLRVYVSTDLGKSWQDITDPNQLMADEPTILRGDMQRAGQVYLGTAGRGLFIGVRQGG